MLMTRRNFQYDKSEKQSKNIINFPIFDVITSGNTENITCSTNLGKASASNRQHYRGR
jgi:hypothetical protein